MALKMKISDFSVNKYKSSITVDFLGLVLFSRGGCLTPNTHTFFGLTYVTNKFIINLKWRKCKDLFKSSIKGNIKIQNSTSFQLQFNYCIHNENEIRGFLKIRMKSKKLIETEIWKIKPWQDIVITVHFWREFPLSCMKNSKSFSVYVLNFLNLLCQYNFCHGIS